jgi:hypothetical protein
MRRRYHAKQPADAIRSSSYCDPSERFCCVHSTSERRPVPKSRNLKPSPRTPSLHGPFFGRHPFNCVPVPA